MKTTVKGWPNGSRVEVLPYESGGIGYVSLMVIIDQGEDKSDHMAGLILTQDQAGALIFGLERAAEAARIAAERESRG